MPNIFNNDTTLPQRIRNINKLNIDQNVIVSINEFNEAVAQPISTYGASLLNTTNAAALGQSILQNTEESVTFLADGANEINFHTGLNGGAPTNANLRLKIDDDDVTSYNDLKIEQGGNHLAITQTGSQSKLKPSGNNGIKIESNSDTDGITIIGNSTSLSSDNLIFNNTSVYASSGTTIYTKNILVNNAPANIGEEAKPFEKVHARTFTGKETGAGQSGFVNIKQATPQGGYCEFFRPDGVTRTMYIGFADSDTGVGGLGLDMNFIALESTFGLKIKGGDTYIENLLPNLTETYNLGSTSKVYDNAYIKTLNSTNITTNTFSMDQPNKGYLKLVAGTSGQSTEAGNIEFYGSDDVRRYVISTGLGAVNRMAISTEPGLSNASIMLNIEGNGDYEFTETEFKFKNDRRMEFYNGTYYNYIWQQPAGAGGYGLNLTYNYYKNQDSPYANVIPDSGVGTSRISLQGTSIDFAVGVVGSAPSSSFVINTGDVSSYKKLIPFSDDSITIGDGAKRWQEIYSVNGTINTSDRRQKTDIKYLDTGLSLINKLKPCSYKWKENSHGRRHYGLIAQDIEMIEEFKNSGIYIHDKDSDNKGLRYTELISPLIKAVQQLHNKFNQLDCSGVIIKEVESKPVLPVLGEIDCDCDCNIEKINILEEQLNENNYNNKVALNKLQDVNNNLLNANDELLIKINELENKLENLEKQPQHNSSDDESDNSHSVLDLIQQRLYEIEKRNTKLEAKVKKQTTIINKLLKSSESTIKN